MKTNLAVLAVCIIGLMAAPAFAGDTDNGTRITFQNGASRTTQSDADRAATRASRAPANDGTSGSALPDPDSAATRASRAAATAYITFPSGNGQTDAFPGVSGPPGAVTGNSASGNASVVGAGEGNTNDGTWATIAGGFNNTITTGYCCGTIGGGATNTASNTAATVAGGADNAASGYFSTVGGGGSPFIGFGNEATGDYSTVSGGSYNTASGSSSTVGGGDTNTAGPSAYATVGGGYTNTASGNYSTVGGGYTNTASGNYSTVGGGDRNTAGPGDYSTVGGGYRNTASGRYSTVAGGYKNTASGRESFAAGALAVASHNNSFVWGDWAGGGSAGTDTFNVHASGGIYLNGSLEIASDRNLKKDFSFVSAREILDKVVELPIQAWRFKTEDDSINHIGPMAQDFMAAFGYGLDERYITSVDIDGVALAAVQGLNERLEEQLEVNTALRWHNAQIHSRNNALEARLARLEKAILRDDEAAGSE